MTKEKKQRQEVVLYFLRKKASAHLEMILAFVIFVGFTFFIVYSLNPGIVQNSLTDSILLGLQNNFFNNVTSNVSVVLVKNISMGNVYCRPTEISGNALYVNTSNKTFFYVYFSSEINNDSSFLFCSAGQNYSLGFIDVKEVVSNKSLGIIASMYQNNYDVLKQYFKMPSTVDFGIKISDTNEYSLEKSVLKDAMVTAGSYRQSVLYQNGTIAEHDFEIKIW